MAYLDREEHTLLWLATALRDEVPQAHRLMADAEESESEVGDPEASRGYVIRDWFGPFLFSPAKRYQRGSC